MKYHRTACPNDISKACLQTTYWEIQLKEKREEKETHTYKWQKFKKRTKGRERQARGKWALEKNKEQWGDKQGQKEGHLSGSVG